MNPIFEMNHSPKMEERESQPLEHERDINALYNDLVVLTDADFAASFCLDLRGMSYDQKCAELVKEIEWAVNNARPVLDIAALVDMADDTVKPVTAWEFLGKVLDQNSKAIGVLLKEQEMALAWRQAYLDASHTEAPAICRTEDIPADPRTPTQLYADLDEEETRATRESDRP